MKNVKRKMLAYLLLLVSLGAFAHADYQVKESGYKKGNVTTRHGKQISPTKTRRMMARDTSAVATTIAPVAVEAKKARASQSELTRNLVSWVSVVSPIAQIDATTHTINGAVAVNDSYELQGIRSFDKLNKDLCAKVRDDLAAINQRTGTIATSIRITGYSAPWGTPQKSEKKSMERVIALRQYLRQSQILGKIEMNVNWVAEDWDTLTELIQRSDMAFKDAVLGVISSTEATSGREKVLSQLADGAPYRYIKDRFYPLLEHIEYSISYTSKSAQSTVRVEPITPGGVGLAHLYITAQDFAKDSQEYYDLMDLGARLFPESPQANINAAAVALIRKDTTRARKYLEPFAMHPAALCNMGILCLLEGNREKAELYLEMAKSKGNTQAQEALNYLKK